MSWQIINADVLDGLRSLDAGSVHCVVTSPPYFALRDYGVVGQIGLERTPAEYIAKMVEVFREVRRVMRDDATLWLNIGDSYAGSGPSGASYQSETTKRREAGDGTDGVFSVSKRLTERGLTYAEKKPIAPPGYKSKDLLGIPWMLAFALRDDGWYLRSEIIWHKRAPMPESVRDRPTKAHEQIFLLTKQAKYFYDAVASAEKSHGGARGSSFVNGKSVHEKHNIGMQPRDDNTSFRNMRSVWTLSPEFFTGAHFATFPTELVRRCLLSGTSEKGCCPKCGAPWRRVLVKDRKATRPGVNTKTTAKGWDKNNLGCIPDRMDGNVIGNRDPQRHCTEVVTKGWKPTCECGEASTVPCLVCDPFTGAGTTCVVARRLGLRFVGFELNPEYAAMARRRVSEDMPLLNRA